MTPRRALVVVAAGSALATLACLAVVDRPLARWLAERDVGPLWDDAIDVLEYAGGIAPSRWIGVAVLAAGAIATLVVPRWRGSARGWLLVATTHLCARNVVMIAKPLTGRLRPLEWIARGDGDSATFWRGGIGFPSGHVVLFASLALPIAVAWPRARPVLVAIPLAMLARVAVDAHFAADATAGLAVSAALTWAAAATLDRVMPAPSPTPRSSPR